MRAWVPHTESGSRCVSEAPSFYWRRSRSFPVRADGESGPPWSPDPLPLGSGTHGLEVGTSGADLCRADGPALCISASSLAVVISVQIDVRKHFLLTQLERASSVYMRVHACACALLFSEPY